jgi:hypothetical protein
MKKDWDAGYDESYRATKGIAYTFHDTKIFETNKLTMAKLKPLDRNYMVELMERFGIRLKRDMIPDHNIFRADKGDISVVFGSDGSYNVYLARPSISSPEKISPSRAKSIASEAIKHFMLDLDVNLAFEGLLEESEGGQERGSNHGAEARGSGLIRTTVLFRQVINNLRVLTPGAGELKISIDYGGVLTEISSSLRPVKRMVYLPRTTMAAPPENYPNAITKASALERYDRALDDEARKILASWVLQGQTPLQFSVVPKSTEIGYDIRGDEAVPIARRSVEVDFGGGFHMRCWVTAPI